MLTEIRDELKKLADSETAATLQWFFKTGPGEYGEGDKFIGIKVPVLRKVASQYRDLNLTDLTKLLSSPVHEERTLALVIMLNRYKHAKNSEDKKLLFDFYVKHISYINNWDLVDISAPHIPGDYLFDSDRSQLLLWAKDSSLWVRRIAILSTFNFIRKNQFDDTLKIAKILLSDKEDLIHKAVGWMLREIGKRDQQKEETFLKQNYQKIPRTTLRYAIERFAEKKRKAYLNGQI